MIRLCVFAANSALISAFPIVATFPEEIIQEKAIIPIS